MDAVAYLRAVAYHEAGHAIVAWSMDLEVFAVRIRPIGTDSETEWSLDDHLPLTDRLALCVAGEVAGWLFGCHLPRKALRSDHEDARELLHEVAADDPVEELARGYLRAHDLLVEHRDEVVLLAEHFLEARDVDAAGFLQLMAQQAEKVLADNIVPHVDQFISARVTVE
jgi:ATP-dependent Zn protease